MNKIKVLIKRPGEPPRSVWISDTLENLQRTVGGYIEIVTLQRGLVVICDEEGRLKGKPHNCTVEGVDRVGGIIVTGVEFVGDIIVAGVEGEKLADYPSDFQTIKAAYPGLWEV